MRSRRIRRQQARVSAEALEHRVLPAGNVTVSFARGNLTVRGDGTHNSVLIVATEKGFEVVGNDDMAVGSKLPTSVNGQSSVEFSLDEARASLGNVNANMGSGVDDFYLLVPVTQNVRVNMGDGRDWLGISEPVGRNLTAKLGSDFDIFRLVGSTVGGNVNLNSGSGVGDDVSIFESTIAGNLKVKAGSGSQGVRVTRSTVAKRASFSLGNGDDVLNLNDSTFGAFRANGGSGSDLFEDTTDELIGRNFER